MKEPLEIVTKKKIKNHFAPQSQSLHGEDPFPFGHAPPPLLGLVPKVAPELVLVGDPGGVPDDEFRFSLSEASMFVIVVSLGGKL